MKRSDISFVAALFLVACGARTGLHTDDEFVDGGSVDPGPDARVDGGDAATDASDAAPDARDASDASDAAIDAGPPECVVDADCRFKATFCTPYACVAGTCLVQATPTCDDGDLCTDDRCDPAQNACAHTSRTVDADGDGAKGPLPGKTPGAADACGTDCNDADARVQPGAVDVCNGIDDNCDGHVDEGASYQTVGVEQRLSPTNATISGLTHVASYSGGFAVGYSASLTTSRFSPYVGRFTGALVREGTDLDLTALSPSDGDGARVAWAGDRFGIVWSDRREGNYEIFFALADSQGRKLSPGDIRLTNSRGFSIQPTVLWTGRDFLVVWQEEQSGYDIEAVRISADGASVGPTVNLRSGFDSRNISVAAISTGGYIVAWLEGSSIGPIITAQVNVMRIDEALVPLTGPAMPIAGAVSGGPALTMVDGKVAVAAHATTGISTISILDAATLSTLATTQLTNGVVSYGRDVALQGIGQRLAVAWADDRDDARTFEIYLQTFDSSLQSAGTPVRVTTAVGDSVAPMLAPFGLADAVLAWNDGRNGMAQVYGRALQCRSPAP